MIYRTTVPIADKYFNKKDLKISEKCLPGVQQLGRTLAPGTLSAGGPERGEAGVEAPPHCYCWASAVLAGEPEPAAAVAARTAVAAAWAPVRCCCGGVGA